jgi:hypothetical protein
MGRWKGTDLNIGNVTFGSEVHPVRLIELGPDHVVQIGNLIILPNQRRLIPGSGLIPMTTSAVLPAAQTKLTCQSQLGMSLDRRDDTTKHGSRNNVHLV